jgi:predicted AAA+ superfamily ATPase
MHNAFKSMGYEVGKNALYEYMAYFEDAYYVFSLNKFDLSHRRAVGGMKKIFTVDQGLITVVTMTSNFDLAAQLETAVFSYLRRQSSDLFYYRTQERREVDFLVLHSDQTFKLIQVCLTLENSNTRTREIDMLSSAMAELKLSKGIMVTLDEKEEIEMEHGTISVVPAWQFFLGN